MTFLKKYTKIISYIALIALILSLIPLMVMGFYTHPVGDDYYYAREAIFALRQSGNYLSVIPAAIKGSVNQYMIWQGTYSAMFLMHLPPQLFGEIFYKIYPSVILLFLTGSIFYMLHPVIVRKDKNMVHSWIAVSSLLSLVCISEVPSCGETFYWYNGSMYYTGFLSLSLIFFGLLFRFLTNKKIITAVFLCLLALFIAGGNYASLLPTILLTATILFITILKKDKKAIVALALILFFLLLGLAVSILAPGNSIRGESTIGTTPIKAIAKSVIQGGKFIFHWNGIFTFVSLMLLTPVFLLIADETKGKIKHPLILSLIAFLIFSSSETATFYAQNNSGPARLFDICFYMMIITVFFVYFAIVFTIFKSIGKGKSRTGIFIAVTEAVLIILFVALIPLRPIMETYIIPNQATAALSLLSGEADYYAEQNDIRMFKVKNAPWDDVEFEAFDVPKRLDHFLYVGDLSADPNDFNNDAFAYFYGLRSVKVNYKEP